MKWTLQTAIGQIAKLTRNGQLADATALIQRTLGQAKSGQRTPGAASDTNTPARVLQNAIAVRTPIAAHGQDSATGAVRAGFIPKLDTGFVPSRRSATTLASPAAGDLQERGQFLTAKFSNGAGSRDYRLYVPSGYRGEPVPLIVMLHGCTQSPEDFAAGTRMNAGGESQTCLVAYPKQSQSANGSKCWNWFDPAHQQRDHGEPSLIAGITRQIAQDYAVDPDRIYIAGLSAGGAAAAVMGAVYPDIYAAVGVHSGLPVGAARDLSSAMAAMRQGPSGDSDRHNPRGDGGRGVRTRSAPTIVFHGDRDTTVNPKNATVMIDAIQAAGGGELETATHTIDVPGGRSYSPTQITEPNGQTVAELWVVHGSGHAWSGGSRAGSFTDPLGPDASSEMMRFFLERTRAPSA
ncbi:MAG: PHB depolymerase family esterase [Hyphomicrobium aestuarii]|nr:PHB depolymerase family esterase [Hyphomicrobium aestuarii]